jgi:hypothetical protein
MKKKRDRNLRNVHFPLKTKLQYWFDGQMAKGILRFIPFFILGTVLIANLIAGLIITFGFGGEEGTFGTIWNSFATVINSDVPTFDAGSLGYRVLMSLVALVGLLFTSVLIGIVSNAIEEKLDNLKRGNSLVAEKNHIIVLGFYPGEYTLLNQLFLAAGGKKCCIVVAEDMARDEMEDYITENLDVPKNIKLVCRTVDITNSASIEKCSVETCRTIVISPTEDMRTLKAILAVAAIVEKSGLADADIHANAIFSRNTYTFPSSMSDTEQLSALMSNNIISRLIAHSCTQTGLSVMFKEILDFSGSEFYLIHIPETAQMRFDELSDRLMDGTPVGVIREGKTILNPGPDFTLQDTDGIIVLSEERDSAKLGKAQPDYAPVASERIIKTEEPTNVVVIGYNETLGVILLNLPKNVLDIWVSGDDIPEDERERLEEIASERNFTLHYYEGDPHTQDCLMELVQIGEHIVIMSDHEKDDEEADMDAIFMLLNLWEIWDCQQLAFNLTVELKLERNQKLIEYVDWVDYVVSFSVSSLILAQIAESPELIGFFREILSDEGNELYLKNASLMEMEGSHTVRSLRREALRQGYVFLGCIDAKMNSRINPSLDETINLTAQDSVILLGED